jgi:hypothetical protein
MRALCRILHDPIVFRNLLWWGNMPSLSIGFASTRVYVREATDGWIFLRSYLDFPMHVLVPMIVSMILQSSRWWIFRVGIPHTTWHIHVLGSLSHQSILSGCGIEWRACVVAYSCDKLLASRAILAGISIPPIPWLIAIFGNLTYNNTAPLVSVSHNPMNIFLGSMTPGTPGTKILCWWSQLKGAWLIKVGDNPVSSIADAQDAFAKAAALGLTSVPLPLLFSHPEIRQYISHDGLPIVSSTPFLQHMHDQMTKHWDFTTVAKYRWTFGKHHSIR